MRPSCFGGRASQSAAATGGLGKVLFSLVPVLADWGLQARKEGLQHLGELAKDLRDARLRELDNDLRDARLRQGGGRTGM